MKVPLDTFLSGIAEKRLYFFSTKQLNTEEPHHFVCVKRTEKDFLVFTCCTSQFENNVRHLKLSGQSELTLVPIKPNTELNKLTKQTYINCNSVFTYDIKEFSNFYNKDAVDFTGEVSEIEFEQILIGIHCSKQVDREIKAVLDKPDYDYPT